MKTLALLGSLLFTALSAYGLAARALMDTVGSAEVPEGAGDVLKGLQKILLWFAEREALGFYGLFGALFLWEFVFLLIRLR
jgi:hypothetical protein